MSPLFFSTASAFREWLEAYHNSQKEVWVGFYKKNSGKTGMNYDQALDEALCYGWIDGLAKRYDDVSYIQRFTPRRPTSVWSKINTGHVSRLIREGKMTPAGLAAVNAAKKDGRWERAYDSPSASSLPQDFLDALHISKKASIFFATLNKANIYAIAYRLQNTKRPETRQKRIHDIVAMLANGKKFH